MHQRKVIRDAIVARLIAAATDADTRVYPNRFIPWAELELPAISVYTLSEKVDPDSVNSAPRRLVRDMDTVIQIGVRADDSTDDLLDALLAQVQFAIEQDDRLTDAGNPPVSTGLAANARCWFMLLAGLDVVIQETGKKPIAFLIATYTTRYTTWAPEQPVTPLTDFTTAGIQYNLEDSQDPADRANDTVTIPT